MKTFIKVMKALSDPSRVRIIKMLEVKEMCVCEIQSALELAQPTISRHLKILEEAELVERRKDGLWVNYRLAEQSGSLYASAMLDTLAGWLNDDPDIDRLRRDVQFIDRLKICRTDTA